MPGFRRSAAAVMLSLVMAATVAAADVRQTDVFTSGQGGYHTYRIPSIIRAANGDLLALCEGRRKSQSDTGDIDLLMRRSTDGGATWGPIETIWDDAGNTCGNPCPVLDETTGTIHLLMTWNRGDDHEAQIKKGTSKDTRRVFVATSTDHGATWSKPRQITESTKRPDWGWYATGPGAGIQLKRGEHNGRLVIPCDHNVVHETRSNFRSHVIYSDDHGKTWKLGGIVEPDVNECEVVELADGRLLLNMRNYRRTEHRARAIAHSSDGGATWSAVSYDPALIEPICQASIRRVRWPSGGEPGLIVFSNPADTKKRVKMTIRGSFDDGATWPVSRTLYEGPAAYSCLIALPGDDIGCLYEADGYRRVVFARFSPAFLKGEGESR